MASKMTRTCSTRSGVGGSSAIGPLLGEAFGGSTGLVDIDVVGRAREDTLHVSDHHRVSQMDLEARATKTTRRFQRTERHSVAEVVELIEREHQLVIRTPQVLEVAPYRVPSHKSSDACLQDRVGSVDAQVRVEVPAVDGLNVLLEKLDQVG